MLISLLVGITSFSQKLPVDAYRVQVVTKDGKRFRGILTDVNDLYMYIGYERNFPRRGGNVPLDIIRKVVIRRNSKKAAILSGAIVGGLIVGFIANESLQRNPPRSPVAYGLTVTFATAGGAAGGLLLGSAVGNLSSRIIRPQSNTDSGLSLFRQLEPFTIRYQQDVIDRLPQKSR